jgi:hypothetical protein
MIKAFLVAASATLLLSFPVAAQSVGGNYRVQGKNFDGSPYSGTAQIVTTSEVTCNIAWKTGSTTSKGICMRNTSSFTAAYQLGNSVGLIIYDIMKDGTLSGVWTIAGKDGVGTEILTPTK